MSNLQLDCGACKTESSMKATKIPRFYGAGDTFVLPLANI